jgi:hypothetical protein
MRARLPPGWGRVHDGRVVDGTVCGPVRIGLAGFDPIFGEVTFLDTAPGSGVEALVGYTVLQLSRAAVDMAHDRLVKVPHLDLKPAHRVPAPPRSP